MMRNARGRWILGRLDKGAVAATQQPGHAAPGQPVVESFVPSVVHTWPAREPPWQTLGPGMRARLAEPGPRRHALLPMAEAAVGADRKDGDSARRELLAHIKARVADQERAVGRVRPTLDAAREAGVGIEDEAVSRIEQVGGNTIRAVLCHVERLAV